MDYSSRPVHWKPLILAAERAQQAGDGERAETLFRHAVAVAEKALGRDHVNVAASFLLLADALFGLGKYGPAEVAYRQAVKVYQALGPDHEVMLVMAIRSLSQVIKAQERGPEANDLMLLARQILFEYQGTGNDEDGQPADQDLVTIGDDGVTVALDTGVGEPLDIRIELAGRTESNLSFDADIDNKFSDEQIVAILQASEAGAGAADLCLKYRIPDDLFFEWKSLYGGLRLKDIRRLRKERKQHGSCSQLPPR